jgi:hypothetical protein
MNAGFSKRIAEKGVGAVVDAWKRSLANHESVEMPLGTITVRRTPKHIRNMVHISRKIGKRSLPHVIRWLTHKDPFQLWWKLPNQQWLDLLQKLNPDKPIAVTPDVHERGYPPSAPLNPTTSPHQLFRLAFYFR